MIRKLFLTAAVFLIPLFVLADGGIFPPPDYYMYETDQRAMIFYENKTETLVLSATFRGDAKDFGWIIPTPSRPDVSKSSDELFISLDELTRTQQTYPMPLDIDDAYRTGQNTEDVYIVETKKVEYYDIAVLTAGDSKALADWLSKNNYQFPTTSSYVLDSYIDNDWYFTAVKINTELINQSVGRQLREVHMIPLELKFSSDKIVYPLKISSVMQDFKSYDYLPLKQGSGASVEMMPSFQPRISPYYPQKAGVLIYVFTPDNKQTIPGFSAQYAGWVEKKTIEELAFDDKGEPWFKPSQEKYFLTKLTRWMSYAEMTNDLYLRNASDNDLVNAESLDKPNKILFWLVMGVSLALLLGIGIVFIYLSRK